MRYWQTAVLGIGCFLLVFWYSTPIVLGDLRSGLDFEDILTLSDHEMSLTR